MGNMPPRSVLLSVAGIPLLALLFSFWEASWSPQLALKVKNPPANAGDKRDSGSVPGSGRFPREGSGNPLQYSCLDNPMDRGAWRATVHRVAKSRTHLKLRSTHALMHSISFAGSSVPCPWYWYALVSLLDLVLLLAHPSLQDCSCHT